MIGSAAVKLATLNLLQQYRSLADDVGNFNLALRDLALQIKLFDGAVQKVSWSWCYYWGYCGETEPI